MKKCTVKCLRDVLTAGKVPSQFIAQAALGLCDVLQDRLDATTKIVEVSLMRQMLVNS